jgi:hypothetical protein
MAMSVGLPLPGSNPATGRAIWPTRGSNSVRPNRVPARGLTVARRVPARCGPQTTTWEARLIDEAPRPPTYPVAVEQRLACEQPVDERGHLLGVHLQNPALPRLHLRERLRADVLPLVVGFLPLPHEEAAERIGPVDQRPQED